MLENGVHGNFSRDKKCFGVEKIRSCGVVWGQNFTAIFSILCIDVDTPIY